MEDLLQDILAALRDAGRPLSAAELETLVRARNQGIVDNERHLSKKKALAYYRRTKASDPTRWASWSIDDRLEALLLSTLRLKPRRTASGVATITVITKPHACSGDCVYCPNDVRMPKSYLHDEPACQRAERNCFDPYLQVAARLHSLEAMGHVTDKVELIVLGGTWDDYPSDYRVWFVRELFRALNEAGTPLAKASADVRRAFYEGVGIPHDADELARATADAQRRVNAGELTHAQAVRLLYGTSPAWRAAGAMQRAGLSEVYACHAENERAKHRVVGLVIETRPDSISPESLLLARRLGATKIQMGIQSLDERVLAANRRGCSVETARRAFSLCRLFGFKIHAHFLANLLSATPQSDKADYLRLVREPAYLPDEVKMYPCALIDGTRLASLWREGAWAPYSETKLVDVLADNVLATPPFVRISRMIRDFSSGDIVAGNKKVNLREEVEREAERRAGAARRAIAEIRHRELNARTADMEHLSLEDVAFDTDVSREHFLQWVAPDGAIAGFLRLSLPHRDAVEALADEMDALRTAGTGVSAASPDDPIGARGRAAAPSAECFPIRPGDAMIREVHVYGKVAGIGQAGGAAQHRGLGKGLVRRACELARDAGCERVHVISSVGTRAYYRALGFADGGLYQTRDLA